MSTFDEWSLKIFFSADLIGSTTYKAKKAEEGDDIDWCLFFEGFFDDFPKELERSYRNLLKVFQNNCDIPTIWKILGDEILFYAELKDYRQVAAHVISFKNCIETYNNLLDKKDTKIVRCKGTIWMAGFPLSNIQIEIKNCIDFIGPSIDLGFRLAKHSTRRKLCISVETALLFSEAMLDIQDNNKEESEDDFNLKFEGLKELKGVYGGISYPIFWLDTHNTSQNVLEDRWLGKKCDCKFSDVIIYCKRYINDNPYLIMPFIEGGKDKYNKIPYDINERKETAVKGRKENKEDLSFNEKKEDEKRPTDTFTEEKFNLKNINWDMLRKS